MDILFVHTNFPAQFRLLAKALASRENHRIHAIGSATAKSIPGVALRRYGGRQNAATQTHPFARRIDAESRRAEQVIYLANAMKLEGISPGIIFAHTGWGEALPLRHLFPEALIIAYCEHFYRASGADVGFDPEFPTVGIDGAIRIAMRNAATTLSLLESDAGIAPTQWQKDGFPSPLRGKLSVIHDGVAIDAIRSMKGQAVDPSSGRLFTEADEIVTYVARNLEPYRGFHIFMRALPDLMRRRPRAEICIIGDIKDGYGNPPPSHGNWRDWCLAELHDQLDLSRVHFLGKLPYGDYLSFLRLSRAHVYLTYPFVLSWSLLEAMALGCLVIGSDTAPVREVVRHGRNGLLVPFFSPEKLALTIADSLGEPARFNPLRQAAATLVEESYDFERVILPRFDALIDELRAAPRKTAFSADAKTWQGQETPVIMLRSNGGDDLLDRQGLDRGERRDAAAPTGEEFSRQGRERAARG
jgi:glycosyltransferase involved in cell wall biosynthesis